MTTPGLPHNQRETTATTGEDSQRGCHFPFPANYQTASARVGKVKLTGIGRIPLVTEIIPKPNIWRTDLFMEPYDLERFFKQVNKEQPSGCWMWVGSVDEDGYSRFSLNGLNQKAAKVSYEHFFGRTDLDVLHKCDNKNCVNPEHLFAGTHSDNMKQRALEGTNPLQKLDVDKVKEIKSLLKAGSQLKPIASKFGLHISTVSAIKTGKIWGWL